MNFYVFRRGDSRIAHFCAKDTLVFRDAEDVAPYKSCFEPHAKIHFPYQRNKKRAIFLIPCRGRRPRRPARKKFLQTIFLHAKGTDTKSVPWVYSFSAKRMRSLAHCLRTAVWCHRLTKGKARMPITQIHHGFKRMITTM